MKTPSRPAPKVPQTEPFRLSIRDPEGVPLNQVLDLLEGRMNVLEFMQSRRSADVIVTTGKP